MVTARQPAGYGPSLLPVRLPRNPAEALPSTLPAAGITDFLSQGSDKKVSDLPLGPFKRKWRKWVRGGTTGQQPDIEETRTPE